MHFDEGKNEDNNHNFYKCDGFLCKFYSQIPLMWKIFIQILFTSFVNVKNLYANFIHNHKNCEWSLVTKNGARWKKAPRQNAQKFFTF